MKNLRHRVLPLDPDLVIYYEANNEIVNDTAELARRRGFIAGTGRSRVVAAVSQYSLLFDLVSKNVSMLAAGRVRLRDAIDTIPRDLPSHFVGVLEEMRQDLAARDVPFMLSTFIVKYRRNQIGRAQRLESLRSPRHQMFSANSNSAR